MPLPTQLLESYLATRYTAATPGGEVVIRVGRRHPEVDALLERTGASCWAYLTAWNPRSRRLPDEENRRRQAALVAELSGRYACLEGEGVAADGSWREPSVLVLGIDREATRRVAEKYEQNAFVYGERGGAAELVVCDLPPPDSVPRDD